MAKQTMPYIELKMSRARVVWQRVVWMLTVMLLGTVGAGPEAAAQSSNDGSLYSRYGIGELQHFGSSQIQALGGVGTGLHSLNYANLGNPATWSDQILTRASAGFTYQNIRITDAGAGESRLTTGFLNGVQFSFPILERRLGMAIGFVPYSRVSYRVQDTGSITVEEPTPDTVDFAIDYEGSGGLQELTGGMGYRLNRHLSLGASLNGIFGIVENGRQTSFIGADVGSEFVSTNVTNATQLVGFSGTLGAFANSSGLFGEEDFLALGLTFTTPATLSGERVRTLGEGLERDTLEAAVSGDVRLPWRLAAGASYQPDARWTLVAGGRYEPWTTFESDLPFPGYTPGGTSSEANLNDRLQAGGGVEFMPAGSNALSSYLERVGYRLGFNYDRSYISPPDTDLTIRTMALTAGLSLPTRVSGTRLDITLQVGTRGTTEDNLVRDVFYRLSANVNIGERWFQTPKLR